MKKLKGAKAGYLSETTGAQIYPDTNGLTLAWNAAIQHFGTKWIPPRPFMDGGANQFETRKDVIAGILRKGILSNPVTANNRLGLLMKSSIQWAIRNGAWTPNAPSTIARKRSSRPLIEQGRLRQGVDSMAKK